MNNNNDGTKQILAKIDKQNFINMNYQNENDNSFTDLLNYWKEFNSKK